jgi:DNA-binding MarR family transcriptional regulator
VSTELPDAQADAWAAFRRMSVLLSGRLGRELARGAGLSEADYEILTALSLSPGERVRALALRCGLDWEKSRLSHQLRRMEQRGLVVRDACPEDSRGSVVSLSPAGREAVEKGRRVHDDVVRHYLVDALTAEQLATLGEVAAAVVAALDGRSPDAPAAVD